VEQAAIARKSHPERIEEPLARAPDPSLRRLALEALVRAAADQGGWTAERRARLAAFRADTAPLVAEAAQFVFPPEAT
jgi:hypothetical protein